MNEHPIDVVVAAFPDEKSGKQALRELEKAKKDGVIDIRDAAVLRRDENNKLHISDQAEKGAGRGAVVGGVAGAAVGIVKCDAADCARRDNVSQSGVGRSRQAAISAAADASGTAAT